MIRKKLIFIKLLINFLLIFSITINPIAQELLVNVTKLNTIELTNLQNQNLLHTNIVLQNNKYTFSKPTLHDSSISYSISITKINNENFDQLNVNYNNNLFAFYFDKKGNVVINNLEFNSYQLKIIALNRNIFLYNNLLAKLGLFLETDSVFNYSNLKIYKKLFLKTSPNSGTFENYQNISLYGNLKVNIYNAFINNGTIICKGNFRLNKFNKSGQIKLGRLEVYKDAIFKNTGNSSWEIIDNTCKFKGNVKGLPKNIKISTSAPKFNQRKLHYHIEKSCNNFNVQQYEFDNPNYLPSFLQISTNEKPIINADGSLVLGNFSNDLPMPNVTAPIFINKKATLHKGTYTGDGIEAKYIKEERNAISLHSAVIGENKFSIKNSDKINPSLKNSSSIGCLNGPISVNLPNKPFSMITDKSVRFPKNDPRHLIRLKPLIETSRFNFLKIENDQIYLYKHPLEEIIFNQNSFGVLDNPQSHNTKICLNNLRFFTSPEIYNELVTLNVFKYTGKPFVGKYNNAKQQLEELIKTGNMYALIHGKSVETQAKSSLIEKQKLNPELRKALNQIIKNFNGNINARELFKRTKQKLKGTHTFVLSNEQISKAPFSFIVAYVTKEKNENCISLALHLAEKPLNEVTIFGQDVDVKAKTLYGNKANFNAKNNIILSGEKGVLLDDSSFNAKNTITFESDGKVVLHSPYIRAKNLMLYGRLGNCILPIYFDIETKHKKDVWSVVGLNRQTTIIRQKIAKKAKLAIENLVMKTKKDNNLVGIDLEKPLDLLILDAGGDNNISCAEEQIKIQHESLAIGIDFCGVSLLIDGELKKCLFDLAISDPLIAQTLKIKNVNNLTDAFAQTTYASIETFRALAQISQKNIDLKSLLSRFGIIDSSGKFNPKITIGICKSKSIYEKAYHKPSPIKAHIATVNGNTFNVEDNFDVENLVDNSKKTNFVGNKEEEKQTSTSNGASAGLNQTGSASVSLQHSSNNKTSVKNINNEIKIGNAIFTNSDELNIKSAKVTIDNLSGDISKLTIESSQDITEKNSIALSVGAGPNYGSISYSDSSEKNKTVNEQTQLKVKNTKDLRLKALAIIGALLNSPQETTLNAKTVEYQNIIDSKEKIERSFSATITPNDIIPIIADAAYSQESEKTINRATVSSNIELLTESDISDLNRDLSKCKEVILKDGQYYRLVVPVVNTQKASLAFDDIKKLFANEVEINAENVAKVTEQFEKLLEEKSDQENILDQQIQKDIEQTEINIDKTTTQEPTTLNNVEVKLQNENSKTENLDNFKFQSHELVTHDDKVIKINVLSNSKENNNINNFFKEKLKLRDYILDSQTNTLKLIYQEENNNNKIIEIKGDPQLFGLCADIRHKLFQNYILSGKDISYQNSKQELEYFNNETLEKIKYNCNSAVSILLDFTFLGPAKLAFQAATGYDPITHEQLSPVARGINGALAVVPIFKQAKTCAKIVSQNGKNLFNKAIHRFSPKASASNTGTKITEEITQKATEQIGTKAVEHQVVNKTSEIIAENVWDMPIGGKVINGRFYTQHALERMAPRTSEVIKELERRYLARGYKPEEFYKCIDPRNIPPSVIENAIRTGRQISGNTRFTWEYITDSIRVITNEFGDVITVIPK